tara:strand:- start:1600 stop:2760 length:1161 start_codon:yes stop_codon:yes gene_type:complete
MKCAVAHALVFFISSSAGSAMSAEDTPEVAEETKTFADRLDIGARLFLDADHYGSFWDRGDDSTTSEAEIRNARIEINYDFPMGWEGRLQVDASKDSNDADIDLGSAYIRYNKWRYGDFTLGKTKEAIGLERNTSADRILTIERSMASAAFTPGKSWGLHLRDGNKKRFWAFSYMQEDDQDDDYEESTPTAVSGRFVWYPRNTDTETIHVGASASSRDLNGNDYRIAERAEVDTGDRVSRSAEFAADTATIYGLEGIWQRGSALLQAEYLATNVEEVTGREWDFNSYYVTGSYFLTGEAHRLRDGGLRRVKTKGRRAWELVARYSFLDARDNGLGSETSVATLGVNYYHGEHIRIMLALLKPDISGDVVHRDPEGEAISLRFQVNY